MPLPGVWMAIGWSCLPFGGCPSLKGVPPFSDCEPRLPEWSSLWLSACVEISTRASFWISQGITDCCDEQMLSRLLGVGKVSPFVDSGKVFWIRLGPRANKRW